MGRDFGDIPEDEPCFFLRGLDRAAPATLEAYAAEAAKVGAAPQLIASALAHAQAMRDYQMAHGSKIPDLKP